MLGLFESRLGQVGERGMLMQRLFINLASADHTMVLAQPALEGGAVNPVAQHQRILVVVGVTARRRL